jgi:predicted peptidase
MYSRSIFSIIFSVFVISFLNCSGQPKKIIELKTTLTSIISQYKAKIGIAVIDLETHDTLTINNDFKYPMQSVYKFPLALAVLHQVDEKKILLQQQVHINREDLRPETWSPLKVKYPEGNIDMTVAELLNYTVSQSDNNGCDILFKLLGGTKTVNNYIHQLGIKKISIAATEEEMGKAWQVPYTNWTEPLAMTKLIEGFYNIKYLSDSSNSFLMKLMIESSNSAKRLKGLLPDNIVVAHKTGTSNTNEKGITAAVNDVGIINLPNGKHIAISVFVSNSSEKFETNEKIIAEISKAVFDYFTAESNTYFEKHLSISKTNDTLPYRLLSPLNENSSIKYPLLVYLHGSGSRGNDNEAPVNKLSSGFTDSLNRINFPCYILVPQCPQNDSWVVFPNFSKSISTTDTPTKACKQTLDLIHELIQTKNIDSHRIYLTGFSMGGEGTFDLLTREPELFACAVPLASVADTSKANLISNIPIWAFHGDLDKVNDVKYTRIMIEAIERKGGNPNYTEIKGVGHDCRNEAYLNEKLWKWVFEQHN